MTIKVTNINFAQVASVYSGKDGACCCGCAGKHTYASTHRDWATKNRGYAVTDDEVNDRSVKTILNKMLASEAMKMDSPDHVYAVVGQRLYVAYLVH